ncbi:MAG: hypothetical protein PVG83_05465 [Acidimicrobiia bacterium]|jgi:predicted lipoprotein with Yx(FWY)xxD motif
MKLRTVCTILLIALVTAACGTGSGDDTTVPEGETETTTTTSSGEEKDVTTTTSQPDVTTTEMAEMADGVHLADTDLGEVLVDADGFTLYVFDADVDGESSCYDACAGLWPPVAADTPIGAGVDASLFGSTARTDGPDQLTVSSRPLYRYTPDANPGDTMGQGFNGVWWVVDGQGEVLEAAAADEVVIDYGY